MEEDEIHKEVGMKVDVGDIEVGKSGELIKNIMINIYKPITTTADIITIGINVDGYTINVMSLLENIAHIEELKGAIVIYDKDQ